MATRVEYNRVTLHNVQTREFRQEAVWDPSGTDQECHEFTIAVVGHCPGLSNSLASEAPTYVLPDSIAQANATANEIAIRQRLLVPRQAFRMLVGQIDDEDSGELENEKVLLEAVPPTGSIKHPPNMDVNNGPKPMYVDVQQIVGTKLYRVEFQIKISLVICESLTNRSGVLSNRWSISEEIDGNQFAVRTIQGRLRVANVEANPNRFRHWVIPDLPRSYRRESISLMVAPDGLTLDYTVTDRQIHHAPPAGCTDWEMLYAVSTNDGISILEEVSVKLVSFPGVDKTKLVSLAVGLIDSRLHVLGNRQKRDFYVTHAAIADYVHLSTIEARMTVQRAPDSGTWQNLGDKLGKRMQPNDPGFKSGTYVTRSPNYYGTGSAVFALVCHLQSPCNDKHAIYHARPQKDEKKKSSDSSGNDPQVDVVESTNLPAEPAPFSVPHQGAIYTFYEITSRYIVDHLKLQLPIAGDPKSSSGSGNKKGKGSRATAVFIRLATGSGVAKRIITVAGERIGHWPSMPAAVDYQDVTGKAHILHHEFTVSPPRRTADGLKEIKRIEGVYTYGLTRPPEGDEALRNGVLPWDVTKLEENSVPTAAFVSPASASAIA
jgi:hypothetical protein